MKRIERVFSKIRAGSAFMPFVTAGIPAPETFIDVMSVLDKAGADIIEVGLPFSDPIADGPTIAAASAKALELGTSTKQTLELLSQVTSIIDCPVVLMTYVNPVLSRGYEKFAAQARAAGIAAMIIPDLPPEEASQWKAAASAVELGTVFLTTPVTPDERIEKIASMSDGFVYYVNLTGVTGSGIDDPNSVGTRIAHVKKISKKPVATGFGISTPELAVQLAKHADGVIVGSQFVRVMMNAIPGQELIELENEVSAFSEALANIGG